LFLIIKILPSSVIKIEELIVDWPKIKILIRNIYVMIEKRFLISGYLIFTQIKRDKQPTPSVLSCSSLSLSLCCLQEYFATSRDQPLSLIYPLIRMVRDVELIILIINLSTFHLLNTMLVDSKLVFMGQHMCSKMSRIIRHISQMHD